MKILFVHQNFPGQFMHLAPALAADPQNTVVALTMQSTPPDAWPVGVIPNCRADALSSIHVSSIP